MPQVVTRITGDGGSGGGGSSSGGQTDAASASWLAPALGEGWGQAAGCRVALAWQGSQRQAWLVKAKHDTARMSEVQIQAMVAEEHAAFV